MCVCIPHSLIHPGHHYTWLGPGTIKTESTSVLVKAGPQEALLCLSQRQSPFSPSMVRGNTGHGRD